jgi:CRP/FNR family transcriptional regulator, polysaccharide utilization system transcription regulator
MINKQDQDKCEECHCQNIVFKKLNDLEMGLIHKDRIRVSYKAGEVIFKQGTPTPYLVCLTSGLAKVYIEGLGKNLILSIVKPVEYILGPGVYADNRHHFSVAALEDSTACLIDVNVFKSIIRQNPDLTEEFIQRLSSQMIFNINQAVGLTQKQMNGRIADALVYLSEKIYECNPFKMTISRQELADLSGMSKESAIRILKEFKDEGILSIDKNSVDILKPEQLKTIQQTG